MSEIAVGPVLHDQHQRQLFENTRLQPSTAAELYRIISTNDTDFQAPLVDETLTSLSLEPMRMVTKLNRKSPRALEKSSHHNVPGRNQDVSGVVHCARLCVICQHSPSGTCRIQILTAVQTFRQRISHYPVVLDTCGAATNSKDTTIKLHSARCCVVTSFVQCYPCRSRCCHPNS